VEDRPRAAPLRGHPEHGEHTGHSYLLGQGQAAGVNPLQAGPDAQAGAAGPVPEAAADSAEPQGPSDEEAQ
jgi:hypothetical protein